MNQVISLYDKTGDGLVPWAADGFECFAYHPHHLRRWSSGSVFREEFDGPGSISFVQLEDDVSRLVSRHRDKTAFLMASPPGEALSTGGARWWRQKAVDDPDFQLKAVDAAKECWFILIGQIFCRRGMRIVAKSACGQVTILKCRRSCRYHHGVRSMGRGRRASVGASFPGAFPAPYS